MKKIFGKYIESDSEKGDGEWRFVGTRIPVRFALEYVADGKNFEWIANNFDKRFPPEAVAEAVAFWQNSSSVRLSIKQT